MHNQTTTIPKPQTADATAASDLRVLIAAGGTGGHVYPAIAIADALQEIQPNIVIQFVGTSDKIEADAVPAAGYDFVNIWISGFHRRFTLKNILFPLKLLVSLVQSIRIISTFKPDAVICCGGYVTGPVGKVAALMNISLFLQEQNSFPGVTNRLLAKHAQQIFTAFDEATKYLPAEKIVQAGNPIRAALTETTAPDALQHFNFEHDKKTLLVLGGSGGARTINKAMREHIQTLHDDFGLQVIWQCGKSYFEAVDATLQAEAYENLRLFDFLHHMPEAYTVADLVVSRAGALSCSEIALTRNAAIFIPSPNVAGDHQTKNARAMADGGAAAVLNDEDTMEQLAQKVESLIFDDSTLNRMKEKAAAHARPNAANEIATEIIKSTAA